MDRVERSDGGAEKETQVCEEEGVCVCVWGQMAPACGDQPEEQVQVT